MDDHRFRTQAAAKLASGALPLQRDTALFGGAGTGASCALCDDAIAVTGAQLDAVGSDGVRRSFHGRCHHWLSVVREERNSQRPLGDSATDPLSVPEA